MKEPKIRFKGFKGEWEKTSLGKLVKVYDGIHQTPRYTDKGIMFLSVENISTLKSNKFINEVDFNQFYKIYPEKGDILMTRIGDVGTPNVIEVSDKIAYYVSLALLKPIAINSYYLSACIQSPTFQYNLKLRTLTTAIPQKINKDEIGKVDCIYSPYKDEQEAIASYFTNLDSLIQSTAKKIESLKQIKAASLQSMFPQEGETKPRVRFKEFEGEWEKVRALDVFRTYNEKNHPELPVLSATQDRGMVTREAFGYNISHDKSNEATYKHILPGQFVIHLRSFQGGFAHSNIEGIASPAYTIMEFKDKKRHFDLFWKYIFMSKEFIKRLELITYGIRDGRSISFDEFSMMFFVTPSYKEQQAIASYFTNLDNQISLQTQRLEKLKQIKSACLDNMFV